MNVYLVVFDFRGTERGLHISAESFDEAVAIVDAMRESAQVEGLVWDQSVGESRGRLN